MKAWLCILLITLICATPLFAAMSDSTALRNAKALFGDIASIGMVRKTGDTNWTREIGVKSTTCVNSFTVLGSGFNTWDAAFIDYMSKPAVFAGPFKGTVQVNWKAHDNIGAVGFQLFVDDVPIGLEILQPMPQQDWTVSVPLDTRTLTPTGTAGFHVACAQARDAAGNKGYSRAHLFRVDQQAATSPISWQPSPIDITISKW